MRSMQLGRVLESWAFAQQVKQQSTNILLASGTLIQASRGHLLSGPTSALA